MIYFVFSPKSSTIWGTSFAVNTFEITLVCVNFRARTLWL